MIIPVGVDYQAKRYPTVTFTLMGLNVAVYLLTLFFWFKDQSIQAETLDEFRKSSMEYWWQQHFWLIPDKSMLHTYVTSLFVHAGFFHLLGNMIYLFLFGSCVEDIIGRWQYLLFYLLGGLFADFTHIAFTPDHFSSAIALGGASGAISACMGAFLILLPEREIEFKYLFWFRAGEFSLAAWLVMSFYFLSDLLWAVLAFKGVSNGNTAFGAHVGGFAAGLLFAVAYKAMNKLAENRPRTAQPVYVPIEPAVILIWENGVQIGPFTRSQVLQMVALGSVGPEAVFWQEGMADWQPVLDL